ncbi:MAG: hypothetical protein HRT72_05345 [Flavobacteriales bacterium]|nr:hypothetical protein [Flavobacteriales bacterium]
MKNESFEMFAGVQAGFKMGSNYVFRMYDYLGGKKRISRDSGVLQMSNIDFGLKGGFNVKIKKNTYIGALAYYGLYNVQVEVGDGNTRIRHYSLSLTKTIR